MDATQWGLLMGHQPINRKHVKTCPKQCSLMAKPLILDIFAMYDQKTKTFGHPVKVLRVHQRPSGWTRGTLCDGKIDHWQLERRQAGIVVNFVFYSRT